ncbi:hypothetical protein EDD76_12073 [Kineothrix alysoides]|uniref:Uncharacterized protein n=2 Tax=Kineothrix alysoides TaxID=1469948 RepID=A0A4R1QL98_9FIRM|nr:hypothetical protein [Kineothrix alysoides]TCL54469.1 hypothetical protein EDD76_12073 [Kineothrix alysoides]
MSEMNQQNKEFVGYEYMEVSADTSKTSFLIDGYKNFGWEIDTNRSEKVLRGNRRTAYHPNRNKVTLYLKRNREIMNKMELSGLQRKFEACVRDIEKLEKSRSILAIVLALAVGIISTACMAGSVFAVTAQPPRIVLCILLAIPAFTGWLLPVFFFKRLVEIRSKAVNPLIKEKLDEIYEICEKGSKLLN